MNSKSRVLVVDDDPAVGKVLRAILIQAGCESMHAESADKALSLLQSQSVDLVISDLRMPGMDGLGLLAQMKQHWPEIPVIILTAHATVPIAVEAMRAGTADFMLKPFEREEVIATVQRTLEATAVQRRAPPPFPELGDGFVARSAALAELEQRLDRAIQGTVTVLLRGESGTGKELAAKLIHRRSARRDKPFVVVDLGAIPENLMESELFGHEKGAFTGAAQRRPGRVELAEGGTLFLDEIGEIPLPKQVKLLRLLQEREYQPLGSSLPRSADVRFIAATHRNLEQMVEQGSFRQDLYYRLSVLPIRLPPLRERPEDVELLARHFCDIFARANARPPLLLTEQALRVLERHDWPGNVRELQHFVERLVVLGVTSTITEHDVKRELQATASLGDRSGSAEAGSAKLGAKVQEAERDAIATALRRSGGNRTVAARLLGISRRSLYNKLADYGLE